jgi:hypothetical protein
MKILTMYVDARVDIYSMYEYVLVYLLNQSGKSSWLHSYI